MEVKRAVKMNSGFEIPMVGLGTWTIFNVS